MKISNEAMEYLNKNNADYIVINSEISFDIVASCCANAVNPKFDMNVSFGNGIVDEKNYVVKQYEDKKIYIGQKAEELIGNDFIINLKKSLFSKKLIVENFEAIDLTHVEDMKGKIGG